MKRLAFIDECIIELSEAADATIDGTLKRCFGADTLNSAVYTARCVKSKVAAVDCVTILGDNLFSYEMLARFVREALGKCAANCSA